jgi:TonB family protein
MTKQTACLIVAILLSVVVAQAQQPGAPFAVVEQAVREEPGGWAGNKERLSTVFNAERIRLGSEFEQELLKWLGEDRERHYWISLFLESESYLHGSKRLPELSLLIKQQGLVLVQRGTDQESPGYAIRLNITAAVLSDELGLRSLSSAYKNEAEALLRREPSLSGYVPGMTDADRRRYETIKSSVISTKVPVVIAADPNPQPHAPITGGIINGRALKLAKPSYPRAARAAGASGPVEVRVVIDENGKVMWARATSGHPDLRQAAEDAAWRSEFAPTRLSGQPVKVSGTIVYNFVFR